MIYFLLGFIIGFMWRNFLSEPEEKEMSPDLLHPRSLREEEKGAVFFPPTDEEEARYEIIARNAAKGEGTKLTEL